MKRTQIYLSEREKVILSGISMTEKKSISELIRKAIDRFYLGDKKMDFISALNYVSGIWKNRKELVSAEKYVRSLRNDRRSGMVK